MEEDKVKIDELQKQLAECQKQKEEYLAGWQRARADFLNHKKEEMERIGQLLEYGKEEMILKFLPILDNFDIAEKNLPDSLKEDPNVQGLLLIKKQILDFLKSQGLEEVEIVGDKFDPNFMEAVEKPEEERKGYKINGRLLRPTKVKINK